MSMKFKMLISTLMLFVCVRARVCSGESEGSERLGAFDAVKLRNVLRRLGTFFVFAATKYVYCSRWAGRSCVQAFGSL